MNTPREPVPGTTGNTRNQSVRWFPRESPPSLKGGGFLGTGSETPKTTGNHYDQIEADRDPLRIMEVGS